MGLQKFQTKHVVELDELNTSQVFGQHICGVILTINEEDLNALLTTSHM